MIITKPPVIKCKKCGKIHQTEIGAFGEPETSSDERNMGYETQYTWELEFPCDKCQNDMKVIVEGWEYPSGIYNYDEFTSEGCIFVDKPVLEISLENPYEEEY